MEIKRTVERKFDVKSKTFDPSKRVVAEDNSFNPDRFVEVKEEKFNPEVRVNQGGEFNPDKFIEVKEVNESERVESEDSNKLGNTLFIMKLISTLNQFGEVEIFGTSEGNISGITFVDGEYDLYVDFTDFPSVEIGKEKYFAEKSGAGVLELALYIVRKTNYINRLMGDNKWSS